MSAKSDMQLQEWTRVARAMSNLIDLYYYDKQSQKKLRNWLESVNTIRANMQPSLIIKNKVMENNHDSRL